MTCLRCGISITGRGRSGCCQKCASIRQGAGTTGGRMSYIQTDMTSEETRLRAQVVGLREALASSTEALTAWMHQYAPDQCEQEAVDRYTSLIAQSGTLAYIATQLAMNHKALAQVQP